MYRLLYFAALVLVTAACPFGWSQSGNSCYRLSDEPATYDVAAQRCSMYSSCESGFGGYLVSLTTSFENQQLMDLLNFRGLARDETWIGLRTTNGPISWDSGEPLNQRMGNPWHPGNPRRGFNMCTVALQGRWATRNCNLRRNYVCEMAGAAAPPAMLMNQENVGSP